MLIAFVSDQISKNKTDSFVTLRMLNREAFYADVTCGSSKKNRLSTCPVMMVGCLPG